MLEFKFNSNILVYFLKQHILAKQHVLVFQDTVEAVLHAGKQHCVCEDRTHRLPAIKICRGSMF